MKELGIRLHGFIVSSPAAGYFHYYYFIKVVAESPLVWTKHIKSVQSRLEPDPLKMLQSPRRDNTLEKGCGDKDLDQGLTVAQMRHAMFQLNTNSESAGVPGGASALAARTAKQRRMGPSTRAGLWLVRSSHDAWSQFCVPARCCTVGRPPTGPVLAWLHGPAERGGAVEGGRGTGGPIPE